VRDAERQQAQALTDLLNVLRFAAAAAARAASVTENSARAPASAAVTGVSARSV
jgi:hypothetical protein